MLGESRTCAFCARTDAVARSDRRHSDGADDAPMLEPGGGPAGLCLGRSRILHGAFGALQPAVSRAEPPAPRAPCSSPAEASGPLAAGRLVCKREAESGRLGSSRDTAALPLFRPPDAWLRGGWCSSGAATAGPDGAIAFATSWSQSSRSEWRHCDRHGQAVRASQRAIGSVQTRASGCRSFTGCVRGLADAYA
jgi:hypothetical protein